MSKEGPTWGDLFKYSGIVLDIVIFAAVGYIIGRQSGNEILGTMVGTLVGTFIMWLHLFYVAGIIKSRKR